MLVRARKGDDEVLKSALKAVDDDGDGISRRKEIESALLDCVPESELQPAEYFTVC